MFRYANDSCPVCGKAFSENDDIVVCPQCGTPHHRECYFQNNGCANSLRHSENFTYGQQDCSRSEKKCFNCGATIPAGDALCPNCKTDNEKNEAYSQSDDSDKKEGEAPFSFLGMDENINDNELIKNIPAGDIKRFVGPMEPYYLPIFYNYAKGRRRFRVNLSAFAGSWAWLISRKMYLFGVANALLSLLGYIFPLVYVSVATKALNASTNILTFADVISSGNASLIIGYFLYALFSNLQFILMVLTGIFGNKLYMNHCVKKVKKINKSSTNTEQFNKRLKKSGGVSMFLLFTCISLAIAFIILISRGYVTAFVDYLTELIIPYI